MIYNDRKDHKGIVSQDININFLGNAPSHNYISSLFFDKIMCVGVLILLLCSVLLSKVQNAYVDGKKVKAYLCNRPWRPIGL
jgi:hypothetical protein